MKIAMMNPFTGESFEISEVEWDYLQKNLQYTEKQVSNAEISENERDLRICYLWNSCRNGRDFSQYLYKHLSEMRGKDLLQKQNEELCIK